MTCSDITHSDTRLRRIVAAASPFLAIAIIAAACGPVACAHDPFVGPATVAPSCPTPCGFGWCCEVDERCETTAAARSCLPDSEWAHVGVSRSMHLQRCSRASCE